MVDFLPLTDMPPPGPKPFFSLLDQALSEELRKQIGRPFWIDTVGKSALVEIRVQLDNTVMRVFARRSAAYASNSEIFLLWMVGTSLVLLGVAIVFLRNQIKPILRLADAAESFGKGREVPNFRPRGAREVRRAAQAFIEMKTRVERAIEQRTAMLAGVSHDLRTVLTRFKLELALIGENSGNRGDEEGRRRDGAHAGGLSRLRARRSRRAVGADRHGGVPRGARCRAPRPQGERGVPRAADRHRAAGRVQALPRQSGVECGALCDRSRSPATATIAISPSRSTTTAPAFRRIMREEVFKPFLRLDDARNQDEGGTGLGLAIARDIARSHGGDITLGDSPLGGLRATVRVPV